MAKGKFIVFEGISGTGKETQAKSLSSYLNTAGIKSQIVYHPSPQCKEVISKWRQLRGITDRSIVYLLLADRYAAVKQIIEPALHQGIWVISLRSYISALVYQADTESERGWVARQFLQFEPISDVTVFFDISHRTARERILARHRLTGEALGAYESLELLRRMRQRYTSVFRNIPHKKIAAGSDISVVGRMIRTLAV
ncbi:dTMP kinase [Candidatus Gottesmanbacteria bacterium RBG_16_52_11]|uniref:Thymidylate kinase n=1 Tax=Candidatus Gottesmanbacteria bacterium RBG_16_52_11 TaxID=1798374 RepID=A0A1F5YPA8_9BACT|nr:MAG: dTMP kinase [Candidatus Gottesmanbacteria bacterium RBG_16_52_11]